MTDSQVYYSWCHLQLWLYHQEQVHQVHGAMGYTYEHRLHHFTRRLWAWRDEWGNEFYWQAKLGQHLASLGADRVWGYIATPS